MFFPALMSLKTYCQTLHNYAIHLLCEEFAYDNNIFVRCCATPIILENELYFALDTYKVLYIINRVDFSFFDLFHSLLQILSFIWLPYKSFEQKNTPTRIIFYEECSKRCSCVLFKFFPYSVGQSSHVGKYFRREHDFFCYVHNQCKLYSSI